MKTTPITVAAAAPPGSPETVDVTLTVNPADTRARVSQEHAVVDGHRRAARARQHRRFQDVTNTGGGSLSFTAGESAPWLSLSPASGSAPATVTVTPSIAGLAPGTYTTPITVTRGGRVGLAEDRRRDAHREPGADPLGGAHDSRVQRRPRVARTRLRRP